MKTHSSSRIFVLGTTVVLGAALFVGACSKKDDPAPSDEFVFEEDITWHQHIAPLVTEYCGSCHTDDGIGPFSIETYEEAKMWASKMERDIKSGVMPPWGAQETAECSPPGSFKDDLRLTDYQKALFSQWIKDGRLEGDPQTAADLPAPPSLDLLDPSREVTIPSGTTVEGTSDSFTCYSLDPNITEPVWLTGSQIVPGNNAIVHHALVFLDRAGEGVELGGAEGQYPCFGGPQISNPTLLTAWAPGAVPGLLPPNVGTPLQPGDRLVMQVHYHPTGAGAETDDTTSVALKWITEEPEYVSNIFLIGNFDQEDMALAGGAGFGLTTGPDFMIPAGATNHQEINRFQLPDGGDPLNRVLPISLWMVGTHMHYVGTDLKITVTDQGDDDTCLIQTPKWDFNWQRGYFFEGDIEDMPAIHLGDILTMRCTYDNSLENPFVREALDDQGLDAPIDVHLGEETLDEMCLGVFGVAVPAEYKEAIGL